MGELDPNRLNLGKHTSDSWEMYLNNETPTNSKEPEDFLGKLLVMGIELNLKSVIKAVEELIPSLESLIGKKINEHVGFYGKLTSFGELEVKYCDQMKKFGWLEGTKYIGEWSVATNQPHGRGILILNNE
jgi:hypothetical protein